MPWIDKVTEPIEIAAHYRVPHADGAFSVTGDDVDWAMERKKFLAREKDNPLNDKEAKRYFTKLYRGFCYLVATIAANPSGDCKRDNITAEIAPFADQAFREMVYRE